MAAINTLDSSVFMRFLGYWLSIGWLCSQDILAIGWLLADNWLALSQNQNTLQDIVIYYYELKWQKAAIDGMLKVELVTN